MSSGISLAPPPSNLEVDFDENVTRLYKAIGDSHWDDATDAALDDPLEAKTWVVRHHRNDDGMIKASDDLGGGSVMWRFLPLHSACARDPPAAVVKALLKAYPEAARCVDDQGMYPLHYACGNQASREVVRHLLVSYPQAASKPDPNGMLPVHYLAQWGPSEPGVVDMLLVAFRNVGDARDVDGNTPLDLAQDAEYDGWEDVVSSLKRYAPKKHKSKQKEPREKTTPASPPVVKRSHKHVDRKDPPSEEDPVTEEESVSEEEEEAVITEEEEETPVEVVKSAKKKATSSMSGGSNLSQRARARSASRRSVERKKESEAAAAAAAAAQEEEEERDAAQEKLAKERTPPRTPLRNQRSRSSPRRGGNADKNAGATTEHDSSVATANSASRDKTVARLRAEVAKLRAEKELAEAELAERLAEEKNKSDDIVRDLEERLGEAESEIDDLRAEQEQMDQLQSENDELRAKIEEMQEDQENIEMKALGMTGRLESLGTSLSAMVRQQERIMAAAERQERHVDRAAQLRREKLQELMDVEDELAAESEEDLRVKGESIAKAFEKQMREMNAISAVIAAAKE